MMQLLMKIIKLKNKKNIFNDLGLINIFSDGLLNNKKIFLI